MGLELEKERLLKVREIIFKIIENESKKIDIKKNEVISSKAEVWETLTEYNDIELAMLRRQIDFEVNSTNTNIRNLYQYKKALQSPYFGKVKFKIEDDEDDYYIGIKNIANNNEIYVYDWRAPISSLFYNHEVGKAKYTAPMGDINGEITEKAQFKINNGEIVRYFKNDLNIDDEFLQEILSDSTDKMKTIVNTIQREQNEIIRNDKDKFLIVQGVAGSGKTSVALHQIAYLMYRDKNINSNNVLVFSPNNVFIDYISNVLPDLGERNVTMSTMTQYFSKIINKRIETYSDFLERTYSNGMIDEIKYKMSDSYKEDIDKFLEKYQDTYKFEQCIKLEETLFKKKELEEIFNKYKTLALKDRIDRTIDDLCCASRVSYARCRKSVKKVLLNCSNITLNYLEIFQKFSGINYSTRPQINYEDFPAILYIYSKINGLRINDIKHIVIDEAQDYNKFQLSLLKDIFNRSSFTILGDVNQTINPYYKYESLEEVKDIFKNSKYLELNKTYRSTQKIIEYSNKILNLSNIISIRKENNKEVEIKTKKDLKKDLLLMAKENLTSIAIITKTKKEAIKLHKSLEIESQLISTNNDVASQYPVIIPSYLSKGLEFDGVIIYENNYEEHEKYLFYVACTRAQHKLVVYEPKVLVKKQ